MQTVNVLEGKKNKPTSIVSVVLSNLPHHLSLIYNSLFALDIASHAAQIFSRVGELLSKGCHQLGSLNCCLWMMKMAVLFTFLGFFFVFFPILC